MTKYSEWYVALLAIGGLIAVPAVATSNDNAFLIGVGFVLLGAGEFINHPFQTILHFDRFDRVQAQQTGRPRRPKPSGIALVAVGIALAIIGIVRIVIWQ